MAVTSLLPNMVDTAGFGQDMLWKSLTVKRIKNKVKALLLKSRCLLDFINGLCCFYRLYFTSTRLSSLYPFGKTSAIVSASQSPTCGDSRCHSCGINVRHRSAGQNIQCRRLVLAFLSRDARHLRLTHALLAIPHRDSPGLRHTHAEPMPPLPPTNHRGLQCL